MKSHAVRARKLARWSWLGEIPSDWDEGKIVHFARLLTGGTPDRDNPAFWEGGSIPWLASGEVNQRRVTTPTAFITDAALRSSNATPLPVGSVLIALAGQGKTKGMVARLGISATCNQSLAAFVCDGLRLDGNFLYYYLYVNYRNIRGLVGDDLRDGLSIGLLTTLRTPLPPLPEQHAIAAFLDRKTAAIDALIAKKERLIELLQEKRQALITQAVTKGLDPTVPMKESGIDWLGRIPTHWAVSRVSFISSAIQTGPFGSQLHAEDYVEGGVPVLNPANLVAGRLVLDPTKTVDGATALRLARHRVVAGDILIGRRGEMGRCALVTEESAGFICGTGCLRVTLRAGVANSRYFSLVFSLRGVGEVLSLRSVGSTMENLNASIVGTVEVPMPPAAEQALIAEAVARINDESEAEKARLAMSVSLLREYRQALISAAVTGKIDMPTEEAA